MDIITIKSILLNVLLYFIIIIPTLLLCIKYKKFNNKKNLVIILIISLIINSIISILINKFSTIWFNLFTSTQGIVNLSTYMSKILFIPSSLFGYNIIIPAYLYNFKNKKIAMSLLLSKDIAIISIFLIGIKYLTLNLALYSFAIISLLYAFINFIIFLKILRNNI